MKHQISLKILFLTFSIITLIDATDIVKEENISNDDKKIVIESKKKFATNESLKFSIDTKGKQGYIYLIYVDKKGGTNVLYPEETTTQEKKSGKLNFPKDFDNIDIKTTKDCKGCKEEKTTIFVLLSDDPIDDIKNMDEKDLVNIQGNSKSRDISIGGVTTNIFVSKVDFFVE